MKELNKSILFYDGDCGFCNWSVSFVLKNESRDEILFCALQSSTAAQFFKERGLQIPDLSTIVFLSNDKLYSKSTAILKICKHLNFPVRLLVTGWAIPRFFRDKMYDFVAKRRRRLMNNFCFLPSESEKTRFLD